MAYNPTQAPAHIEDFDGLRKWIEEELRNLAQNYADDTKLLDEGTGSVAADLAALDLRVDAAETTIVSHTSTLGTHTSDIATLDTRVDMGDDYVSEAAVATAMVSTTAAAFVSETIPAGTWDLYGVCHFASGGATSSTDRRVVISSTAADVGLALPQGYFERRPAALDWNQTVFVGPYRVTLGSPTTYYLNAQAVFSGGGLTAQTLIEGRRVIV